ncbi:hypothetical protein PspLS_00708 [Pyricularia sp. CBS 133598]|nr:hypothetical protein PspLS_00708 [Pyricularia sp. CBS 133598]
MLSSSAFGPLTISTALLTTQNLLGLAVLWLVYQVLKALYNVSPFHPLAHIPGPKLAAATYLPEFYYDVIQFGRYTHQIRDMHRKYGPIVRINPNEIHCNDPNFSDEIYAVGGRKRDKPQHQINGAVLGKSGFGTRDHDLHRTRRIPLAKFFSRAMISRLEGDMHELVQKLCDKLLAESGNKEPVDVTVAYSCFTSDTISDYCFGESFGFLEQKGWYPNFRDPTAATLKIAFFLRFFPWCTHLIVIGHWLINFLPTDIALLIQTMQIDMPIRVIKTKTDMDAGIQYKRPTVFGSLLHSELEQSEKEPQRLADEAGAVIAAGTETASWALAIITFHLLSKPHLLEKLQAELRQVVDSNNPKNLPPWSVLETLPYMNGVIQEGLRLSYGVSGRTARVATQEDLVYHGTFDKNPVEYVIPRGYAVGMSATITHHDETVYPDSYEFIPERWLDGNSKKRDAERASLSFSKGSRSCPGKSLAMAEMNLALAALAIRVLPHATLYETTVEDVLYDHDMFIPRTRKESKGVRVKIN